MLQQILLNLCIVVLAVVLYSPGFVGLSLSDPSILKSGLSIICVPVLIFLFYLANRCLFDKKSVVIYQDRAFFMDSNTGDHLIRFQNLAGQLRDLNTYRLVHECIGLLVHIFARVCDNNSLNQTERELRLDALKAKVGFYMDSFGETLVCMVNLEKYGCDFGQDADNHAELIETLKTLRDIFRWILDEESGVSGSKIISEQDMVRAKAELDGYMDNVVRNLAEQYNKK